MGCSSSRDARGDIEMPALPASAPAERRQSLRPRSGQSRAASMLGSLGLSRGQHDGVHAYSPLPLEEMAKGGANGGAVAAKAGATEGPRDASRAPTKIPQGGKRGLVAAFEDAASVTSSTARWPASSTSSTAQWPASPSGWRGEPSPSPLPVQPVPDFDPAILSGFPQTLVKPSPSHPAVLFPEKEAAALRETVEEVFDDDMGTPAARDIPEVTGFVRARVDEFHERLEEKKKMKEHEADEAPDVADEVAPPPRPSAGRAGKAAAAVVVYFTSLRGVRRTFEDGRAVRAILRCYRVRVDERDVSMHAAFKAELCDLLGGPLGSSAVAPLPRVFVGDGTGQPRDLGGADGVRALHEAGELAGALAGCELPLAAGAGSGMHLAPCAACSDMRFLLCETCYGSRKVFAGDEAGGRLRTGMFRRCPDCNENGLIRCPLCCY